MRGKANSPYARANKSAHQYSEAFQRWQEAARSYGLGSDPEQRAVQAHAAYIGREFGWDPLTTYRFV